MIAALPLIGSAVSSLLGTGQAATATKSVAGASGDQSFSSVMASFSKDAIDKLKTSETMSVAGLQGKATVQSVVESVMTAQESLQTVLAVRDKAVSAFQEVSRMSI